jgi:hypothetical protein
VTLAEGKLGEKRDCREFITSNARETECTLGVQREETTFRSALFTMRLKSLHRVNVARVLCNCELSSLRRREELALYSFYLNSAISNVRLQLYSFNEGTLRL